MLLAATGAVLSLAIVVEHSGIDTGPLLGLLSGNRDAGGGEALFTQFGTWILIGIMTGLVFLARGAFRDADLRRAVNIIWDVVAFWPHATHPIIPTPYCTRVVGDLVSRIRHHLAVLPDEPGRSVIVCAHSQGSLVSFAALSRLTPAECRRVAFLTFGSQLRVIFSRAFPAYVNLAAIVDLDAALHGSWLNVYRDTDPLAGPVLSWDHDGIGDAATSRYLGQPVGAAADRDRPFAPAWGYRCGRDVRLIDPVPRVGFGPAHAPPDGPANRLFKHSQFWRSPLWERIVAGLHADVEKQEPGLDNG